MKQLYYINLTPSGTANVLLEMLANNNPQMESPCTTSFRKAKDISIPYYDCTTWYVEESVKTFNQEFRLIDWSEKLDFLENLFKQTSKSICMGTFLPDTIEPVKQYFGKDVTTISVNYATEDYEFLYHIWTRAQFAYIDLEQYDSVDTAYERCYSIGPVGYSIPKSKDTPADYIINIKDLYNEDKFKSILKDLNCYNEEKNWELYGYFLDLAK